MLAAAVALFLAAGSLTLALSAHNLAVPSGRIASQSAFTNNSASSKTHPTGQGSATPHPKSPTPKPKTSSGTPVTNPTPQPTPASTPVINPTPQPPTPTPQLPRLCLNVNPQSLALTGTQGGSNVQYLTITNCSSVAETWTSYQQTNDGYNWIRTSHTSYTLNPGASQSEGVQASLSGLGVGTYTGYLSYYVGSNRMVTITVTLVVS